MTTVAVPKQADDYTCTYTNNTRSRPQQPKAPQQGIDLLRLGRGSGPRGDSIEQSLLGRAAGEDLVHYNWTFATEAARSAYDLLFVSGLPDRPQEEDVGHERQVETVPAVVVQQQHARRAAVEADPADFERWEEGGDEGGGVDAPPLG